MQTIIDTLFTLPNLLFCIFTFFVLQIRMAVKTFNGESQLALLTMNLYALFGSIAAIIYLGLIGYRTQWYVAIGVFVLAFLFNLSFGNYLSRKVRPMTLVFAGFVLVPLTGIFTYYLFISSL